jgi:glucose-1-phosphate thymidylyltransferase
MTITKGIILAGGAGTRLFPVTRVLSKQLLPVYDKPMVYYPLSILMLSGLRDILIISTPGDLPLFRRLFGDGEWLGVKFQYAVQKQPHGLAEAFLIGEQFLDGEGACLILGDNLIFGQDFTKPLSRAAGRERGATVFAHRVANPSEYGVVEFDTAHNVLSLEEKPVRPKTNYAVPGLYFYDQHVCEKARSLKPSERGELEITDLNRLYLEEGSLRMELLGRGTVWMDMGTHESLHDAASYIQVMQKSHGLHVGNVEEIAFRNGWIGRAQLSDAARSMGRSSYAQYLNELVASVD